MDCHDAQFYLRLRRPGSDDLDTDATSALDRHIAVCPSCAAAGQALAGFDAAIGRAMRSVHVPEGLCDQLFAEASTRRGLMMRRKAYRYAAAAASLLVTGGLAFGVYSVARPQADSLALIYHEDELGQPQGAQRHIEAFLRTQRLPELPDRFDPALFVFAGTGSVQGRDVPVIVFRERNGTGLAKVYVFRDTAFKLSAIRDEQASLCTAKAYPIPTAGITYVVVYTGMDLAPFLRGGGGAV